MPVSLRPKWPKVALDSSSVAITGQQIRQERLRRRLTQQDLADKAGVSLRTIGRVERGELQDSRNFAAIATQLGLHDDPDATPGRLLRDASMHEALQHIQHLYDEAIRLATEADGDYLPGSPDLTEDGLIPGPTGRTEQGKRDNGGQVTSR